MDKFYKLASFMLCASCMMSVTGKAYSDNQAVAGVSVDVGLPLLKGTVQYSDGYPDNYYDSNYYYSDPYYGPGAGFYYYSGGPYHHGYYNDWHGGDWHGDHHWEGDHHGDHNWHGGRDRGHGGHGGHGRGGGGDHGHGGHGGHGGRR